MNKGKISKFLGVVALSGALMLTGTGTAFAYDANKTSEVGMVRGDLSTAAFENGLQLLRDLFYAL